MHTRPCSVAGMFYPQDPSHLEQLLEKLYRGKATDLDALGIVAPHAGYIYSGDVAAYAYTAIPATFSGTFVIVGPSHRGYLTCTSAIPWETPLGVIEVDNEFIRALDIKVDEASHRNEHSIEVQMPFIRYRFPHARVVPLMMGEQSLDSAKALAEDILRAIASTGQEVKIVASSDFSHYIREEVARRQDLYAIEALATLNVTEFYQRIEERGVSACGYGPIACMCLVAQGMGARRGFLLRYSTSGDVTADHNQVVGYGAIAVM